MVIFISLINKKVSMIKNSFLESDVTNGVKSKITMVFRGHSVSFDAG